MPYILYSAVPDDYQKNFLYVAVFCSKYKNEKITSARPKYVDVII